MELDLLGHAFYSSLKDLMEQKAGLLLNQGYPSRGRNLLMFSDEEIERALELYRMYPAERLAAFELSFIRIMGLVSALKPFCRASEIENQDPWWLRTSDFREDAIALRKFVEAVESIFADAQFNEFKNRVGLPDTRVVEDFLRRLP